MMFGNPDKNRYPCRDRKLAFIELFDMNVHDPDSVPTMSYCLDVDIDYYDNTIRINGHNYDLEYVVVSLLRVISNAWIIHNSQHMKEALAGAISRLRELGYIEEIEGWRTSNTILYRNSGKNMKE